jgi:serine/threonine protein kinase/tetratricopeptide (TPR) repeat protein
MTDDPSERFRRLGELFDQFVDLSAAEREAAIENAALSDARLERELRELLAADESSDSMLSGVVSSEARAMEAPDFRGTVLGSWRIVRALGEGGMGTVYLAERADGAYEAKAAIKVVRGGIPSPMLAEHFRSERQILAGLAHSGVARLLDGGNTADGTPYLVLEYIEGAPITDWCDSEGLDVEARLRVFLEVCDTVAYAHRELVAHRDLKPSNILVTSGGTPKLLDFGIAKLMDAISESDDSGERVTRTVGIMTPAYASPEQVLGDRAGVPADIYALGVILYELLSGRLPLETRGLTSAQLLSRVTGEVPPVVSSTVPPGEKRRRLSGDLDAIVSHALRKEPEARYASVEALADDIRLHLEGLPIKVRRDDWSYRTTKLVRRNRGVVSGTLLIVLLGISFTVNAVLQARAVGIERDRAEAQRASAERVSAFLEELFSEADPNEASAPDVTVREILDRGAGRVFAGLHADPEVQTTLAMVMGRVYRALGEYEASEPLLDSALAVRTTRAGFRPSEVAATYLERGALAYDVGDYESAVRLLMEALDAYRAELGDVDDPRIAGAMDWVSVSLSELGRMDEAESVMREAVAMHRRLDPEPNRDLASALVSLTDLLRTKAMYAEALETGAEALAMVRRVHGDDHLEVAHALNQHASTLSRAGRPAEAVPFVEEGLAIRRAVFDGPHVEIAASLGNLANILAGLERLEEALVPRRESADMMRAIFPGDHPYVAATTHSLGDLLFQLDRVDEAEAVLEEALDSHRAALPVDHPNLGYPLTSLGRVYRSTGRLEASVDALREAYRVRVQGLPERHWHIAASGLELGRTLDALGRSDEAEQYLTEAHAILVETFGDEDSRSTEAREALEQYFLRRGMVDGAVAGAG